MMAEQEQILETYSQISDKTGQMLDAARSGDWDRLIALEQDCSALAATLRRVERDAVRPDAQYLQRKAALIRKVLADDAEIRRFTEPWMVQLETYLGSARQAHRLRRAYETDHDG